MKEAENVGESGNPPNVTAIMGAMLIPISLRFIFPEAEESVFVVSWEKLALDTIIVVIKAHMIFFVIFGVILQNDND